MLLSYAHYSTLAEVRSGRPAADRPAHLQGLTAPAAPGVPLLPPRQAGTAAGLLERDAALPAIGRGGKGQGHGPASSTVQDVAPPSAGRASGPPGKGAVLVPGGLRSSRSQAAIASRGAALPPGARVAR